MSRRRYLSTDAGRDKALRDVAAKEPLAATFYLLSIPAAGDDRRLACADPDELLWEVWPAMSRHVDAGDVERWTALLLAAGLWEQDERGLLLPASFYKYQTYISERRRGTPPDAEEARESAQPSINKEAAAQNSAEQRTSAQNGASFKSSFSFSSSSSPSLPPHPDPTPERGAPDADAPDAPSGRPSAALAVISPAPKPAKNGTHPFTDLWDAFTDVMGEVSAPNEKNRRAKACQEVRQGHYTADQIRQAAAAWPNVMADATMTEMGIASNMGRLLRGPQRNGRHAGTVTQHRQTVTEYANVNRGPKRGAAAIEDDGWRLSEHAG